MSELAFSKSADRPYGDATGVGLRGNGWVDLSALLGNWVNTRNDTLCIDGFILRRDADRFLLEIAPHGADGWGEVPVSACASSVDSQAGIAFFATYDFGFIEHRLAANANKGLIIIAAYSLFKDASGRHDYFTREFFYRQPPAER